MDRNDVFAIGGSIMIGTLAGLLYFIGKGDGEMKAYGHCAAMLQDAANEAKDALAKEG